MDQRTRTFQITGMYTKTSLTADVFLDVVLVTIVKTGKKVPEMTADIAFIATFFVGGFL